MVFAGYLAFYLTKDHCFADGNKRVAWSVLVHVMRHHGVAIDANADEAVALINGIATNDIDIDEFLEWIVVHVTEAPNL